MWGESRCCGSGREEGSFDDWIRERQGIPGVGARMAQGVAHSHRGAPDRPQDEDGDTVRGRAERAPWAPSPYLMIWGVPSGGQVGSEDPTRTSSGCMSSFPQWKRMAIL